MVLVAATLFALNGVVAKVILASGISSLRLTQVRSTGALLLLGTALLIVRPRSLRVTRRELPFLVVFGICGVAFVQWFYFLAIGRLSIGVALVIQYLAPLLVALWARFALHEPVRRTIWLALVSALAGLVLLAELPSGFSLDELGALAAFLAAVSYAAYVLLGERAVGRRDPASLTLYGFLFAALFWALLQPLWGFPVQRSAETVSLLGHLGSLHAPVWLLMVWMVLLGTIAPFGLVMAALHDLPATRVGITAMVEPVVATAVAWVWLGQELAPMQLAGGALVLVAIGIAQSAR